MFESRQLSYFDLVVHSIECNRRGLTDAFGTSDLKHRVKSYLDELTAKSEHTKPIATAITEKLVKNLPLIKHSKHNNAAIHHIPTTITQHTCPADDTLTPHNVALTLIHPVTANIMEHAACIPMLSRTLESWISVRPWFRPADSWLGPKPDPTVVCMWNERDLIALAYHLHETAGAVRALPRACTKLARDRLPPLHSAARELAGLLQRLAELEEKQPGVVGALGQEMPRRVGDLAEWEAKGSESTALLRRAWADTKRCMNRVQATCSWMLLDTQSLSSDIGGLGSMVKMLLEWERRKVVTKWLGSCVWCAGQLVAVLQEARSSIEEVYSVVWADITLFKELIGITNRARSVLRISQILSDFKEATRQANDMVRCTGEMMNRFSSWSETIEGVQYAFREWELHGETGTRGGIEEKN
ncbi:uncharacterized protein B0H64DRAFT_472670 [Chaetomium fimeti]|uniref:Uncharacterized protein n=1 Tax=Chaetomium fimeti TaxID=1854472 RepID=A0AAE0HNQ0_9PEZI|nr:hypothetical protein B0H64DRAFT_472670 [Chaetomium fimeti]